MSRLDGKRNDLDKLEHLSLSLVTVELNRIRHMPMRGLLVDKCLTWAHVNRVKLNAIPFETNCVP